MAAHPCSAIVVDYHLRHGDEIPVDFYLQDRYPVLQNLRSTADQGCSFCLLLINSISETITGQQDYGTFALEVTGKLLTEGTLQSGLEEEENGVYLLLLNLRYLQKEIPLYFSVYAASGSVAATSGYIRRRPLHQDIISPAAIQLMNGWIDECCSRHDGCRPGGDIGLPTRVLDLFPDDLGADCRLIQSDNATQHHASYIALSHCWGSPASESLLTTTSSTLGLRMQHITLKSLPQNFKDAVTTTRLLGVRYLWIDSLCIIQDSKEDWEREGGRMSQIYKGAYLTLAATAATNADQGFLARPPLNVARLPFAMQSSSTRIAGGCVFLRLAKGVTGSFESDVDMSIWNSRGWTLQERYLSRRVLHFGKEKLYFECRSTFQSEDNEPILSAKLPAILDEESTLDNCSDLSIDDHEEEHDESGEGNGNDGGDGGDGGGEVVQVEYAFQLFYRLVGQYSPRKLTFSDDKLPALAGIASEVQLQSGSEYLAGLWEDDLAFGLLWMASIPEANMDGTTPAYRGPSWSWIHLDGQITWQIYWNVPECPDAGRPARSAIEIVDAQVEAPGFNPFGQVTSAFLILRARSISVSVSAKTNRKNKRGNDSDFQRDLEHCENPQAERRRIGFAQLDYRDYPIEAAGRKYKCLQIHEQIPQIGEDENAWSGLVLEQIEDKKSGRSLATYKRIGIYLLTEDSLDIFHGVEDADMKIV